MERLQTLHKSVRQQVTFQVQDSFVTVECIHDSVRKAAAEPKEGINEDKKGAVHLLIKERKRSDQTKKPDSSLSFELR